MRRLALEAYAEFLPPHVTLRADGADDVAALVRSCFASAPAGASGGLAITQAFEALKTIQDREPGLVMQGLWVDLLRDVGRISVNSSPDQSAAATTANGLRWVHVDVAALPGACSGLHPTLGGAVGVSMALQWGQLVKRSRRLHNVEHPRELLMSPTSARPARRSVAEAAYTEAARLAHRCEEEVAAVTAEVRASLDAASASASSSPAIDDVVRTAVTALCGIERPPAAANGPRPLSLRPPTDRNRNRGTLPPRELSAAQLRDALLYELRVLSVEPALDARTADESVLLGVLLTVLPRVGVDATRVRALRATDNLHTEFFLRVSPSQGARGDGNGNGDPSMVVKVDFASAAVTPVPPEELKAMALEPQPAAELAGLTCQFLASLAPIAAQAPPETFSSAGSIMCTLPEYRYAPGAPSVVRAPNPGVLAQPDFARFLASSALFLLSQ